MTNPLVSIVVVNWNTEQLLRNCLASIRETCIDVKHEVLVCDNASSDGSVAMVEREFAEVRLVKNSQNVGFARANNQLIRLAKGEFILLLNSDAELHRGALLGLASFLQSHADAGACAPKLINQDGRIQPQVQAFPTLTSLLRTVIRSDLSPFGALLVRRASEGRTVPCVTSEAQIVSAACMLVSKRAMDEVGMLNEQLYFYGEEADFCYRLKQSKWKVWYVPEVSAFHLVGASSEKNKELDANWNLILGRLTFLRNNSGRLEAALACAVLLLVFCWALLYSVARSVVPVGKSSGRASLLRARLYVRRIAKTLKFLRLTLLHRTQPQ